VVRRRTAEQVDCVPVDLLPLGQPLLLEFVVELRLWEAVVVWFARPHGAHVTQLIARDCVRLGPRPAHTSFTITHRWVFGFTIKVPSRVGSW
jgi:hypothetical protein